MLAARKFRAVWENVDYPVCMHAHPETPARRLKLAKADMDNLQALEWRIFRENA